MGHACAWRWRRLAAVLASGWLTAASASAGTTTTTYTYDALGRLTSATESNGARVVYSYDQVNNRIQVGTGVDPGEYNLSTLSPPAVFSESTTLTGSTPPSIATMSDRVFDDRQRFAVTAVQSDAWIQVDLGSEKTIGMVKIAPANDTDWQLNAGTTNGAALEYSPDGSNWTMSTGSVSNAVIGVYSNVLMGGVTARYIRLHRSGVGQVALGDFRIYATASDNLAPFVVAAVPATVGQQISTDPKQQHSVSLNPVKDYSDSSHLPLTIQRINTQGLHGDAQYDPINQNVVTYTPAYGYSGADSFTYEVTDAWGETALGVVNVTVIQASTGGATTSNNPPSAPQIPISVVSGGSVTFNVLAYASDPDGDPVTLLSVANPPNYGHAPMSDTVAGQVTYTPDAAIDGGQYNPEVFNYTVVDSHGAQAVGQIVATVIPPPPPPNHPPIAVDDHITAPSIPHTFSPLDNDSDQDGDLLSVTAVSEAGHGSASIMDPRTITYTPEPGYLGGDSFSYDISDGKGGAATATVYVTVTPNTPPTAVNDNINATAGVATTFDPRLNDSDADGNTLTVTTAAPPAHGSATVAADGASVTYRPSVGYTGPDSFNYTISDGHGGVATATVSATVLPGPRIFTISPAVAGKTSWNLDVDGSLNLPTAGSWTVTPQADFAADVKAWGAAGGGQTTSYGTGGGGGFAEGQLQFRSGVSYRIDVGAGGGARGDSLGGLPGGGGGATGAYPTGAGGGGFSGVRETPGLAPLLIAGGGGGAGGYQYGTNGSGGAGGGTAGEAGASDGGAGGAGGAQTSGAGQYAGGVASGNHAAGGGGGYYGGFAGADDPISTDAAGGGGGGGSGYADPAKVGAINLVAGLGATAAVSSDPDRGTAGNGSGAAGNPGLLLIAGVAHADTPPTAVDDTINTNWLAPQTFDPRLNDSDANGDPLTIIAATQPSHGVASFAAGSVTYTPANRYVGADSFTYTISDGRGATATATVSVAVSDAPNTPPSVAADSISVRANQSKTFDPRANDSDAENDPLTVAAVTAPLNGQAVITGGGTAITYTPGPGYFGPDQFEYDVSDGRGGTSTGSVNVMVLQNALPIAANLAINAVAASGLTFDPRASDSDPDGDPLTITAVTAPAHGAVAVSLDGTSVTYTAQPGYLGADSFNYTISDGQGGTATARVDATVFANIRVFSISPAINGRTTWNLDLDGNLVFAGGGGWTLTPKSTFQVAVKAWGAGGTAVSTYAGGGGGFAGGLVTLNSGETYTVTVGGPADGSAGAGAGPAGGGYTAIRHAASGAGVIVAGGGGGGGWGGAGGAGGGLTGLDGARADSNDNGHGGTQAAGGAGAAAGGQAGSAWKGGDSGTAGGFPGGGGGGGYFGGGGGYYDSDGGSGGGGGGSGFASPNEVTSADLEPGNGVTPGAGADPDRADAGTGRTPAGVAAQPGRLVFTGVNGSNSPPIAVDDVLAAATGVATTFDPRSNDSDANGDILSILAVGNPTHGTATFTDGSVTYTSVPGYEGGDSFTYTVQDQQGAAATATVNVTVRALADGAPIAVNDTLTVRASGTGSFDPRTNDTDPDHDPLTVSAVSTPAHGSASIGPGGASVTYAPAPAYSGSDSFSYTVSDGRGGDSSATVSVTVTADNQPVAADDTASTLAGAMVTLDPRINDSDPDGDPLKVSSVSAPAHGKAMATADGGSVIYTPSPGYTGPDSFAYTVSDGFGGTAAATVTVNVLQGASVDYLVVAGGGGGATNFNGAGGGGGGGGVLSGSVLMPAGGNAVIVGLGGGAHGQDSYVVAPGGVELLRATGGGGGGSGRTVPSSGGSGGGGSGGGGATYTTGGVGIAGQGFAGGAGNTASGSAGGGGGAGGSGGSAGSSGADGGIGLTSSISGTAVVYGSGGGGGAPTGASRVGTGGSGAGSGSVGTQAGSGVANRGGGGGGSGYNTSTASSGAGGSGGSGAVIFRYPTGAMSATGGVITTAAGYTIHIFNASGTFTVGGMNTPPVAVDDAIAANWTPNTFDPRGNDSDADGDPLTVSAVGAPAHGAATFTGTSITYQATYGYVGADSFTYVVSDGRTGSAIATVNVLVTAPAETPPTAVNDTLLASTGVPATFDPRTNDNDADDDPLTVTAVTQPSHGVVTIEAGGTALSYTANGYAGADSFTYTISDGRGGTATATVSVTVGVPLTADYLVVAGGGGGGVGVGGGGGGGGILAATGYTFAAGSYPVLVGVGGTGSASGDGGNGGNSSIAQIAIAVGGGGGGGNTHNGLSGGSGGGRGGYWGLTGGAGVSGQGYAGGGGSGSSAGGGGGAGAPGQDAADTIGGAGGKGLVSSISGLSKDYGGGGGSGGNSDGPLSPGAAGGASAGAGGYDGAGSPGVRGGGGGGGGASSADGSQAGGAGGAGVVIIRYPGPPAASGGAITQTGGYTIHTFTTSGVFSVANPDTPPVAVDDSLTTDWNHAHTLDPRGNDSDSNGDPLTITQISAPAHGTAAFTASSVTYTPVRGYAGSDSFTYVIADGHGGLAMANVNVSVTSPPETPPVALNDSIQALYPNPVTFDPRVNDSDADGDVLTITAVTAPAHGGVIIAADGTALTYAAATGYAGSDAFTYTITDGRGGTSTATVNVTIPLNLAVEYLIVGGGGGGGGTTNSSNGAGGGGGGGVLTGSTFIAKSTNLAVAVGAGGGGGANGGNSTAFGLTAIGGGGGAAGNGQANSGASGGSGGGGSNGAGGAGVDGQGHNGGASSGFSAIGGGGGGAGAPAAAAAGGSGLTSAITGGSAVYGAGGGGGDDGNHGSGGPGGDPTAGAGGYNGRGQAAAANHGGGGGGAGERGGYAGGAGGSGVVIIRYPGSPIATGGIITQAGGYTIHTFTATGTLFVYSPPTAVNDELSTYAAVTFDPRTNDSTPNGDTLAISAITQPAHGTASFTGASITYAPANGYVGTDSLTYAISDEGGTATATVAITVTAPPPSVSVDYLLVGGGGGGGGTNNGAGSGGGGAGGVLQSSVSIAIGSYPVTIGAGGHGSATNPTSGGDTAWNGFTAKGGGYGGSDAGSTALSPAVGGSGGGGEYAAAGAAGTSGQGFAGGSGYSTSPYGGGGGGGAGAAGTAANASAGGAGGAGFASSITGAAAIYAAGGGGGSRGAGGAGGAGGGGAGAGANGQLIGVAGSNATGYGSGGGGAADGIPAGSINSGGNGSAGVVIIRYPTGAMTATGGAITTSAGYTIHTFTSSGTFQRTQ